MPVTPCRSTRVRTRKRDAPPAAGIRQFLDVGTGLPTHDNTHEVAQRVAPESRIVYVNNDPLMLVHARALLTSAPVTLRTREEMLPFFDGLELLEPGW